MMANEIETYLKELGFKKNHWGFLKKRVDGVEFVLMEDFLNGYTLSYSFIAKRTAMNSVIPLGRKAKLEDLKNAMNKVLLKVKTGEA
jgi:hypothetical protein